MQMRNHLFMAEKGVPMDTTSLAVRSGVPSLHYSFGHFRYSQLKPILRIRKSHKIHIRFLLGLRLVRKFNGKMFSVIQSPPDR